MPEKKEKESGSRSYFWNYFHLNGKIGHFYFMRSCRSERCFHCDSCDKYVNSATIVHFRSFSRAKTLFSSSFVNGSADRASRSGRGREKKVRPREKVGNYELFFTFRWLFEQRRKGTVTLSFHALILDLLTFATINSLTEIRVVV